MLAGPATYRALVAESGWSYDRYVSWLTSSLSTLLLP
jgi:hypothetical protein